MSFRGWIYLGLAVLLVGSLSALVLLGYFKPAAPGGEEVRTPAPVKAVPAKAVRFGEWTELLGVTQPLPDKASRLSAAVEGRVLTILGDGKTTPLAEGQQVKANQIIVQLDDSVPRAYRGKLMALLGDLAVQKKEAQAALERAEKTVKDAAPADAEKARQTRTEAQARQLAVASMYKVVEADLTALDAHLAHFSIRAPFTGELGLIQVTPGQAIAAGTTVAELVNLDEIDLLCHVPPRIAGRLKLSQGARLASGEPADGKIVFLAAQADPDTGNLAIKVRFANTERRLRANRVQRLQVLTQPVKERLTIPEDSLLEDQSVALVLGAVKPEKPITGFGRSRRLALAVRLRPVLGIRDRDARLVEILQLRSAQTGELMSIRDVRFIVEGGHGLHDDDLLKVEGGAGPAPEAVQLEDDALKVQKARTTFAGRAEPVWTLTFSPDGKLLASADQDGIIRLWETATGKNVASLTKQINGFLCIAFAPDGKTLASGSANGTITLWEIPRGKQFASFNHHDRSLSVVTFSPDGKTLASAGSDGTIKLWNVLSGKNTALFTGPDERIGALLFSPDGKLLASGCDDMTIKIWDVTSGKTLQNLEGPTFIISALAFSPDGKTLLSWSLTGKEERASGRSELVTWEVSNGRRVTTLEVDCGTKAPIVGAFGQSGKVLAFTAGEKAVMLRDGVGGEILATLQGHTGFVTALAFSPDGSTLATASLDNTIKLWDVPRAK
jgi:RND family efflux transporter MFP subunit